MRLEGDATMVLPIVDDIVQSLSAQVEWATATHLLDLGCGPGIVTCALARHAPVAHVTALDSSVPLLARVRHHAAEAHLATRVHTVEADIETALPALRPMDVVWAGMVLHHLADPGEVLTGLLHALQPGGTLVMLEFAGAPAALPDDDPLAVDGTWARLEAATTAARNERLGLDPVTVDWAALLTGAGFTGITDTTMVAHHRAPLEATAREWLERHVRSGIEFVGDALSAADVAALTALAHQVSTRNDLFVSMERRVLTARRPIRGGDWEPPAE